MRAEGSRANIWKIRPRGETHPEDFEQLFLLRNLLVESQDRVSTVGQEVTLDVNDLDRIDERSDNW